MTKNDTKTRHEIAWEKARKPANDARKADHAYTRAIRASYDAEVSDDWLYE